MIIKVPKFKYGDIALNNIIRIGLLGRKEETQFSWTYDNNACNVWIDKANNKYTLDNRMEYYMKLDYSNLYFKYLYEGV